MIDDGESLDLAKLPITENESHLAKQLASTGRDIDKCIPAKEFKSHTGDFIHDLSIHRIRARFSPLTILAREKKFSKPCAFPPAIGKTGYSSTRVEAQNYAMQPERKTVLPS